MSRPDLPLRKSLTLPAMGRWRSVGKRWVAGLPRNERAVADGDGYTEPSRGRVPAPQPVKGDTWRCPICGTLAPYDRETRQLGEHRARKGKRCPNRDPHDRTKWSALEVRGGIDQAAAWAVVGVGSRVAMRWRSRSRSVRVNFHSNGVAVAL